MIAAGLHLIVRLGGERIALPASDIESVIEIDALAPVPRAPAYVAGLAALRSRILTVIDGHAALGLPPIGLPPSGEAIMVTCEGHCYALLVEAIEDAIEVASPLEPLRVQPAATWARVARGIVAHEGEAILVIAPRALLAGPVGERLAAVNSALTPAA